jgi:hypothetical protein
MLLTDATGLATQLRGFGPTSAGSVTVCLTSNSAAKRVYHHLMSGVRIAPRTKYGVCGAKWGSPHNASRKRMNGSIVVYVCVTHCARINPFMVGRTRNIELTTVESVIGNLTLRGISLLVGLPLSLSLFLPFVPLFLSVLYFCLLHLFSFTGMPIHRITKHFLECVWFSSCSTVCISHS